MGKPGFWDDPEFAKSVVTELKAAKEQITEYGGYRTLVKALGIPRTAIIEAGGLGLSRIATEARYFTPSTDGDQRNRLSLIGRYGMARVATSSTS